MKILILCLISVTFIFGTSHIAYCPNAGYSDSGGYKGSEGYKGKSYSGSEDIKGSAGSKVKTETSPYSTTLGQELMDLEAAHKNGVINEQEYIELKKIMIEQRTKKDK